ncbi:carbohydrate ABC transporter permease [Undibacterium sp. SXout20W]|uniref:carbohydrate ABC transporter permease n=1 Tax=Undibacterium sp. SXout20W TaxID=3413051 RepID=UPI003BF512B9
MVIAYVRQLARKLTPWSALLPFVLVSLGCYLCATLWTLRISLSSSRSFPKYDFVGISQYQRLFDNQRWFDSLENLLLFGSTFIVASLVTGFLLAVFIDQKIRTESLLRTIFLYPYAMSFVATGLVWQWILDPENGIQQSVRQFGWSDFVFDWIVRQDKAIYAVALAAIWQISGVVMALMLAGLRSIDNELWNAARIDGIPTWRVYGSIILPMLKPTIGTIFILLLTSVVKVFDVVVSMTQGGPGTATDVPAKFIMDHLFSRANLALASAGAVTLLVFIFVFLVPIWYWRKAKNARVTSL